jgi:alpha-galactosidase
VTRNGIVVGSVTHDTWKTGVYYSGASGKLDALHVFGGAGDATSTHDVVPHGKVSGNSIASPIVFVGYAPDWRDLIEEFADTNLAYKPELTWSGGTPFGWNSWGKLQTQVSYAAAVGVSDFVRSNLQNAGFADNGVVYVNLDSYWDNLSDAQLDAFVARCHANGQRAGIYWTPFVDWGKSATRQVEGTPYTYSQVWLRDASGRPIALDGAYAIDPTHPGTKGRIDTFLAAFKRRGFEFIKLDFLTHGALESAVRFDPNVQTGVQAYNQGMQYIVDGIAGTMFISESIAPLFPHGYAHGRRISCDVSGAAVGPRSAQYEMNSASYGWWISGRLYPFNDPDMMVFEGFTPNDNVTRLLSAVVSGTVFLDGDDLSRAPGQALARTYLTNDRINGVARLGKAFRPVEANTGTSSPDVLALADRGTHYIAVFNFGPAAVAKTVDLARAGLDATANYAVTDLWTGAATTARGTLTLPLAPGFARLFALR